MGQEGESWHCPAPAQENGGSCHPGTGIWRWQHTWKCCRKAGNGPLRGLGAVRGLTLDVSALIFPNPSHLCCTEHLVCAAEVCDWGEPCKHQTGVMKCWSSEPHLWSHDLISLCACTVIPSLATESHCPSPGKLSHPVCGMGLFWGEVTAVQ